MEKLLKKSTFKWRIMACVAIATSIIIHGCTKENLITPPAVQISEALKADTNFVGLNIAGAAAREATGSRLIKGDIASSKAGNMANSKAVLFSTSIKILDSLVLPDNVNPSLYVFNYVGGGFIIVAADKRVEPILAFSSTGYFKYSNSPQATVNNWINFSNNNMQVLRKTPGLKQPGKVAKMWAELSNTTALMNRAKSLKAAPGSPGGPPVPPCQDTYSTYYSPVLLLTAWGQDYPYNLLCPNIPGARGDDHAPSGCVATSIAQVMYYWKSPSRYNWTSMPLKYDNTTPTGNQNVAQLMVDVGKSVRMIYTKNESYPNDYSVFGLDLGHMDNSDALKNNFGYKNGTDDNYNSSIVQSDIDRRYPVLLYADNGTDGHQWVCDGYYTYTYTGCPGELILGYSNLYLHMNWGWDGNSNAYFGFNNWTVLNGTITENFNYNKGMTYNIHP
jgi:hypothetical protein